MVELRLLICVTGHTHSFSLDATTTSLLTSVPEYYQLQWHLSESRGGVSRSNTLLCCPRAHPTTIPTTASPGWAHPSAAWPLRKKPACPGGMRNGLNSWFGQGEDQVCSTQDAAYPPRNLDAAVDTTVWRNVWFAIQRISNRRVAYAFCFFRSSRKQLCCTEDCGGRSVFKHSLSHKAHSILATM